MLDHGILPVDERRQVIVSPDENALIALLWLLQHKTQPGIVALVFNAGEATPTTFEADTAGLPQTDASKGAVGSTGKGLSEDCIEMLRDPADTQLFGCFMQAILGKSVLLAQPCKGAGPLLFLRAGDSASLRFQPRRHSYTLLAQPNI